MKWQTSYGLIRNSKQWTTYSECKPTELMDIFYEHHGATESWFVGSYRVGGSLKTAVLSIRIIRITFCRSLKFLRHTLQTVIDLFLMFSEAHLMRECPGTGPNSEKNGLQTHDSGSSCSTRSNLLQLLNQFVFSRVCLTIFQYLQISNRGEWTSLFSLDLKNPTNGFWEQAINIEGVYVFEWSGNCGVIQI